MINAVVTRVQPVGFKSASQTNLVRVSSPREGDDDGNVMTAVVQQRAKVTMLNAARWLH